MKVIILAGGFGTRLSEDTEMKPKPMVEIGGHPILWHIMKIYSHYGFNDFVILTGYKSHIIKDYFINYYTRYCDVTVENEREDLQLFVGIKNVRFIFLNRILRDISLSDRETVLIRFLEQIKPPAIITVGNNLDGYNLGERKCKLNHTIYVMLLKLLRL